MSMLSLALKARLPLIHVTTDDIINAAEVLSYIADEKFKPIGLPATIDKASSIQTPPGSNYFYTSDETKSMAKLYRWAVDEEKTVVFINTEKSVLQFDGEALFPPREMVLKFLNELVEDPERAEELLPAFGGLTLKDVAEVSKLTMTRDESITVRGVNETRRGYAGKLRGITQVDTNLPFYMLPDGLDKWLKANTKFFLHPIHPSLVPRGLLFDGPPGTGKTMAAKAIAGYFGVPLYRLDLGEMMGKYVGESEGNLITALAQIDQVEPCVILFDEVEKLFALSGDSGVTSRLLSQLLWYLQEHKTRVFSVLTTNAKTQIPPELYREGRIDSTMMFLGLATKEEGQEFALGAIMSMAHEIKYTITAQNTKKLTQAVNKLYTDGQPVPQAKLTQVAFSLLKEFAVEMVEA